MSSNTIGPLPKKSDTLIEKVIKASGDLDYIELLVEIPPPPPPPRSAYKDVE